MTIAFCYLVIGALVAATGWLVASVAVHETRQHRTRRRQQSSRSDRRVAPVRKAAAARRNREAYRHIPEEAAL